MASTSVRRGGIRVRLFRVRARVGNNFEIVRSVEKEKKKKKKEKKEKKGGISGKKF